MSTVTSFDVLAHLRSKAPLRRKLRRLWHAVINEQTSPEKLGLAVALGVFWGFSPFYGFQVLLCLLSATVLRLNKIAVLLGVQVSTPPFTPLVVFASLQLGSFILSGHGIPFDYTLLRDVRPDALVANFILPFIVGCFTLAALLTPALGLLTVFIVRRHNRKRAAECHLSDEEFELLLDSVEDLPFYYRWYASWKARLDPVYPMVLPHLEGRREVVDLGGGIGLLEALLARRSLQTRMRLMDWDRRKISMARRVLAGLPQVSFEQGDARTVTLGNPDALVLIDVLHYAEPAAQQPWLRDCARALEPGGVLLIRELDSARGRRTVAQWVDAVAVRFGWNRGPGVTPWPISEMVRTLESEGFRCSVAAAGRGAFRSNVLLTAHKS